eukprot:11099340-Prorocentrum_lima.AAC.1
MVVVARIMVMARPRMKLSKNEINIRVEKHDDDGDDADVGHTDEDYEGVVDVAYDDGGMG